MRTECFEGNGISDKRNRDRWEADGSKTAWQRANERAKKIIASKEPARLDKDLEMKIRERFDIYL